MWIEAYTPALRCDWDRFVGASKNGTFLFLRDYLEYHRHRFEDHSLLARDRPGGSVMALLPAHRRGALLDSHGGLTYGGWICGAEMTAAAMVETFAALRDHLHAESITLLRYRAIPHVYHRLPAEEDLYALSVLGARLVRRAPLSVIDQRQRLGVQSRRQRGVRRARAAGLICRESQDLAEYWQLLSQVLESTYGARPVHTLAEISALREALPAHIRLFGCYDRTCLLGGVLIYETATVARAQYIAASPAGRRAAALDLLFTHLIEEVFADKRYIDLGTSAGDGPAQLNTGVLAFKESLGARLVAQDTYELSIEGEGGLHHGTG